MSISTKIITSPFELSKIEPGLDAFLNQHCKNPFMLLEFIKPAMKLHTQPNQVPAVIVNRRNGEIIGVSYVLFRRFLGSRTATFLIKDALSPDFILANAHREAVLKQTLEVFFKTMKCQAVSLTLPMESPNSKVFESLCVKNKISHHREIDIALGHRILPIECSWQEFNKKQGKRFRKRFRVTERDLNKVGRWQIIFLENLRDDKVVDSALQKNIVC
jgi:CelD/BcsL family acetyltransferase involved in cellulose biosynthesis